MSIDRIIKYVKNGKIKWSVNGLERMQERGISIDDVVTSIVGGEIIEEYPKVAPAKSSVLIYGKDKE